MPTAIPARSDGRRFALLRISSTAPGSAAPCEVAGRAISPATRPFTISAMLAMDVPVSKPRTGPVELACASSRSALHNPRDVIENDECHQRHQQKQADLKGDLAMTRRKRF